ncbi:MAG: hypothetical protein CMA71_04385 [Euryarchaeota archaeon]|nr:hypothetical protein [Euryarchaeota archaeon]
MASFALSMYKSKCLKSARQRNIPPMMRKKSEIAATSGLNGSDRKNPNAKRSEKREKVERIAANARYPMGPLS